MNILNSEDFITKLKKHRDYVLEALDEFDIDMVSVMGDKPTPIEKEDYHNFILNLDFISLLYYCSVKESMTIINFIKNSSVLQSVIHKDDIDKGIYIELESIVKENLIKNRQRYGHYSINILIKNQYKNIIAVLCIEEPFSSLNIKEKSYFKLKNDNTCVDFNYKSVRQSFSAFKNSFYFNNFNSKELILKLYKTYSLIYYAYQFTLGDQFNNYMITQDTTFNLKKIRDISDLDVRNNILETNRINISSNFDFVDFLMIYINREGDIVTKKQLLVFFKRVRIIKKMLKQKSVEFQNIFFSISEPSIAIKINSCNDVYLHFYLKINEISILDNPVYIFLYSNGSFKYEKDACMKMLMIKSEEIKTDFTLKDYFWDTDNFIQHMKLIFY